MLPAKKIYVSTKFRLLMGSAVLFTKGRAFQISAIFTIWITVYTILSMILA